MSAPLTIYRASAGAGKTFRLVVEYIKLLMLRPDEYKHILAVTFTKKATQEMKIRILSQLYGLREGLASSDGYLNCITKETGLTNNEVKKNAGVALKMILNDYNHFRIETIDSFFQRVLRNMTRELDISSNMRVELNGEQVKDKAIDQLIDSLEPNDHLLNRVIRFAEENMEEGKTWNVIQGLKDFGSNIFSNFYQSHAKEYKKRLENTDLFKNYKNTLYAIKKTAENDIKDSAAELRNLIEANGMEISLFKSSNTSGFGKLYEKQAAGDFIYVPAQLLKCRESDKEWLKKSDITEDRLAIINGVLIKALNNYLDLQTEKVNEITTCTVILNNLNNIELLGAIEEAVNNSNTNANRFLLSSTNQLLSEMIGDSDAPFIYEKIGTQVKHLMIDEFQDTSTLQWANFKNLLLESMSHYEAESARGTVGSMIVGDVKQSIYRWRDGDWALLSGIKNQFVNESDTEIKTLDTNFRSEANIINFNNAFFLRLKDIYNIESAYDDVAQKVKPGRKPKGEIEFYMLSENLYKERHSMICDKVAELISRGVKQKDIAILGRNGGILKELSKTFMNSYPEIRVVSMESFLLNASSAVKTIICALRLLQRPNDKILLATLEKYSKMSQYECENCLNHINKTKPLLDIVEDIFTEFNIGQMTEDSAFISAFYDHLKSFVSSNTSTIRNFLKHWDESLAEKAIETEATDGVQMLTIHKSKGLEFDNVIMADGNWETKVHRNSVWVELNDKPYSDIPFTIIKPSKSLENSMFSEDYENEKFQFDVDNLNMLYVGFTRAGKNLYYYGKTGRKKYEDVGAEGQLNAYDTQYISGKVEECLDTLETDLPSTFYQTVDEKDDSHFYYLRHFGEFCKKEEESKEETGNVFDMPVEPFGIKLHLNKPEVTFVQSNRSKDFVQSSAQDDGETPEGAKSTSSESYISVGLLLHNVLSKIENINDVDEVISELEMEGVISNKSHSALIKKRISDSKFAKEWFAPHWTVYNECSILTSEGTKRPDRVITDGEKTIVIDFKFGKPKPDYVGQVEEYKQLLMSIGMPNVQGYLWYVYDNKVEEV